MKLATLLLSCVYLALACLPAATAAPSEENLAAFNFAAAKFLNGEKIPDAKVAKFFSGQDWRQARRAVEKAMPKVRIAANGTLICRLQAFTQLCWSPIWREGKLGIAFDTENAEPFFPSAADSETFRRELGAHFTKAEHSWLSNWIPRAEANPLSDKDIAEEDSRVIFATWKGWETPGTDYAATILAWQDSFLQGQVIRCHGTKSDQATLDLKGLRPRNIQQDSTNSFKVTVDGKKFRLSLVHPADVKSCMEQKLYYVREAPDYQKNQRFKRRDFQYLDSLNRSLYHYFVNTCNYPLPQARVILKKCDGEICDTSPSIAELAVVLDLPQAEVASYLDLEKEIFAIYPDAKLGERKFGIKDPSAFSGKQLAELERLDGLFAQFWVKIKSVQSGALANLQAQATQVAVAGKCCASDDCKKRVWKKGINMIPANAPLQGDIPGK